MAGDGTHGQREALQEATHRTDSHKSRAPASRSAISVSLEGQHLARGRFQVLRTLGTGGMGVVYEARDAARGHSVALKHLVHMATPGGYALKSEFRSLAGVEHANVVRLYEMFCEEEPWFFTMELVQGLDLVHYVRGVGGPASAITLPNVDALKPCEPVDFLVPINMARLSSVLVQLVHGLKAIHAAGKLHCDIKPSNVVVSPEGRLVILDFGLVTEANTDPNARESWVAGTPGYIAPERFAGHPATKASDWYSVGVVLHESLTGRLPSPSRPRDGTLMGPLPIEKAESALFERLETICNGLLVSDPQRRWDGDAVLEQLGVKSALPRGSIAPTFSSARSASFIGRQEELSRIEAALAIVRAGSAAVVLVGGESGIGKSALLAQFVSKARTIPKALVFQSRCYERESVRYKTFDGVMDQLATFWARLPEAEATAILPRDVGSLAQVFGVLDQVPAVANLPTQKTAEAPDPHERQASAFRSLRELLGRLGDRYLPIIVIDDLQWGDAESAHEMVGLLSSPDAPPVLLVGAFRSTDVHEESPLQHLLHALRQCAVRLEEVAVSPLSEPEVSELASSLSEEQLTNATLRRISDESKGSPFFVSELVRHARRQGELAIVHAGNLVHLRIAGLARAEQHVLELISVAPAPVKQRVLREASNMGHQLDLSVSNLLAEGLIRARRGEAYDLLEPYHDRIREAIIQHLSPQTRQVHHRTFVRVLRENEADAVEVIAAHLEGAGETSEASESYAHAADKACAALAFDHAAQLYEKSLSLVEYDAPNSSLLVRQAEALAFAGHGPRSAKAYVRAGERSPPSERHALRLRAAEQLLYAGHHERAMKILRQVLPHFGVRPPTRSRWLLILQILYNVWLVLLSKLVRPKPSRKPEAEAQRAQICESLGDGTLYVNLEVSAYFQQKHVLAGLKAADPGRVAMALTSRALLIASPLPRLFHTVLPDLDLASELSQRSGDPYVRGRVLLNRAIVYSAAGRYTETNTLARRAEVVFRRECQGVKWGLQHALAWQSVSLFYLGRFRELSDLCREHLPEARRRGDEMLSKLLAIWAAWVAVAADHPEEASRVSPTSPDQFSADAFTVLDAGTLTQRGPLLLYLGRPTEAWTLYERCMPLVRRTGVLTARARAHDFHWTRGLIATHLVRERRDRRVEQTLREDLRNLRMSRTDDARAMAEHLEGNLLLGQGRRSQAIEALRAASRHYAASDMHAWAETLRYAVARLGDSDAERDLDHARQALLDCGVGHPERWVAMWCPGT